MTTLVNPEIGISYSRKSYHLSCHKMTCLDPQNEVFIPTNEIYLPEKYISLDLKNKIFTTTKRPLQTRKMYTQNLTSLDLNK